MRSATIIFIWSIIVVCIVWDIFVYKKAGVESTISRVLLEVSQSYPGWTFLGGILVGHLFFSQRGLPG